MIKTFLLIVIVLLFSSCTKTQPWVFNPVPPYGYIIYNTETGEVKDGISDVAKDIYDRFEIKQLKASGL